MKRSSQAAHAPAPARSFGPLVHAHGVHFRLWAPSQAALQLELIAPHDGRVTQCIPMQCDRFGWHRCDVAQARAGTRYRFRLNDRLAMPDPASRSNPLGVHGPSEVVGPDDFAWTDGPWRGRPWHEAVLYELHIGTFTPQGRLDTAIERLPALKASGITALQLMPLAEFGGARGWGYDGVLPFAVESSYGRPDDLKRFVDAAHALGLMVLLDAVYNHFGPDGNYLGACVPEFFDAARSTPWGPAIAFDGPHRDVVRRFFVESALHWVEAYHVDGLRLDAVHTMRDGSTPHIVAEVAAALQAGPGRRRCVHVVLENDDNRAAWLIREPDGRAPIARAQWNDDLHHAAHVLATAETQSYYAAYADAPAALLGSALAEGFVYQGQASAAHRGEPRGEPSAALPPTAFVSFLQTHDQIGNRAFGERLDALAPRARIEALLACVLLAPQVPMLFMGEEFAATTPFLYFCDFDGVLGQAVVDGRRREFAGFAAFNDPLLRARIPDPNAVSTFMASKLRWAERDTPAGARRLALVERLLTLRHALLVPRLAAAPRGGTLQRHGEATFEVTWPLGDGARWRLRANFGDAPVDLTRGDGEQVVCRVNADEAAAQVTRLHADGIEFTLLEGATP